LRLHSNTALVGALAAGLLLSGACGEEPEERPQWLVTVRTDAPIPDVADRLVVEITDDTGAPACSACRRVFDAAAVSWPISFGIVEARRPLTLRARLYLARDAGPTGAPAGENTLDVRARLPATPRPVAVELGMACFGVASTDDASCDPSDGELHGVRHAPEGTGDPAMSPGSFAQSKVPPCGDVAAPDGMACVDGGLFFLRAAPGATQAERAVAQLVRVSSFQLDRDEFTVRRLRRLLDAGLVTEEPGRHTNDRASTSLCTYRGRTDASADDRPLNCVSLALAAQCCAAEGSRLVREAELAYVAGNGARGTAFPWGDSEDVCARAVVERGAFGGELDVTYDHFACRVQRPELVFGPVSASLAGAEGDTTQGVVGIRALGGNLSEWVADDYAPLTAPCWRGRPVLIDPVCTTDEPEPTLRGGAWNLPAFTASATFRVRSLTDRGAVDTGFRCARSL
jgi:formylglycine-generating enzyme